jgi:uncharacterized lipoprotein YbaY
MAIVIHSEPTGIVSAYTRQLVQVIESTATTIAVIKITVEGHDSKGHWRVLGVKSQTKYRNTNYFQFEISDLLKAFLSNDNPSNATSAVLLDNYNSSGTFRVKYEHFEAGVSQSTSTGTSFVAVNTIPVDRWSAALTDYILDDTASKLFLTRNKTQYLRSGEHLQFHFLFDESMVGTVAKVKTYPISGSASTASVSITAINHEVAAFYGIDGDTLTVSPAHASVTDSDPQRITSEDGIEFVGMQTDNNGQFTFNNTDIGKTVKFSVYAQTAGNIKLTFNGTATTDIIPAAQGWNTLTSIAIPTSTTSIKMENLSGSEVLYSYVNIVTASYATIINNRAIVYLNEYDATASKIELWVENDSTQITETLTVHMQHNLAGLRLAWLADSGTVEHYTFNGYSAKDKQISKNKIASNGLNETQSDRGVKLAFANFESVTTIYTFFEDSDVLEWLSNIATSPEVYLVDAYNDITPIDVITSNFPIGGTDLRYGSISFKLSKSGLVQNG